MKPTISKSAVMKRAWNIFRGRNTDYNDCFAASLRRAWEVEKMNVVYYMKKAEEAAAKALRDAEARRKWEEMKANGQTHTKELECRMSAVYEAGLLDYYHNSPRGTYFGD